MSQTHPPLHLAPNALQPLPLGQVRPAGWLLAQLRIQADGLSGHLDEFWPDVARSGWIGGDAEGWERGPYWLDGVIPLAFLLDDRRLKEKAQRWVDYILTHQREDGWLGPVLDTRYGYAYDPWPVYVTLKALAQYHDATDDARVLVAMQRFLRRLDALLDEQPLMKWAHYRWADLVVSIHWLYEHTQEGWLLALAGKVREQGFDWREHFVAFPYKEKTRREDCNLANHVVNNAMAIKAPGVWFRQSGDEGDRDAALQIMDALDRYHGQVTGVFTGDEHLAGRDPSQGTELCAVVEYMYSLEALLAALGQPALADRLERIAFNALPATFKPDMWAHQYDQQANQVICRVSEDCVWTNNGPDSNIFGLAPNYGCCTANLHQGWPKLAAHLWMRTPDGGLATVAYAPSAVSTEAGGGRVEVSLETDYPFGEALQLTVRAPEPVRFPLHLRVPAWVRNGDVQIEGEDLVTIQGGTFHVIDREWNGQSRITLRLPASVELARGHHGSVAISRGPLVYSLPVSEEWKLVGGEPPHGDWEVYPAGPWSYGLLVDERRPERSVRFDVMCVDRQSFSPEGAPISARVVGRRLPGWTLEHNAAGPVPRSPVVSPEPLEELTLVPYGCTNLRVTEFPRLER